MGKRTARRLDLPPPFRLTMLREAGDAFAHACAHAAELGAGALVRVGRFDLAEFAVVLEPEEALVNARRAFYAGMAALAEALAALAPPQKPIAVSWPDAVRIGGGPVGGGRFGWPEWADELARPDWLVFGALVRTAALAEEEFEEAGAERLVEGFARHLMTALDCWREDGFGPVALRYLANLEAEPGARRRIAENGDLETLRDGAAVERCSLRDALAAPSWLDPRIR